LYSAPSSASYAPNTSGTPVERTNAAIARSATAPDSLLGEPNVVG